MKDIEQLLETALMDGIVVCDKCGNSIEPDAQKCRCGWVNPLIEGGYI